MLEGRWPRVAATLIFLLAALHPQSGGFARADIADCSKDSQCDQQAGECCARVIVKDAFGNSVDSHYCLELQILKDMGDRYYFKGILGRAYCDVAAIVAPISVVAVVLITITMCII